MMRHIPKLAAVLGSVTIGILGFQGAASAQVNWGKVPTHHKHHHHYPVTGYPGPIHHHHHHHHIYTTGSHHGGKGGNGGGWKLLSKTHHVGY